MSEKTGRAEATHRERAAQGTVAPMLGNFPQDADGNYLAIVSGAASNLVPTVQFGNVLVGPVTITRVVAAATLQEIIDGARETQRVTEYVVGVECRLLQWAVDPASKIASPVDAKDAFAAPPVGYDPTRVADPRDAQAADQAGPVPTPAPVPAV